MTNIHFISLFRHNFPLKDVYKRQEISHAKAIRPLEDDEVDRSEVEVQ